MNTSKKAVLAAASTGTEAHRVLEELSPEYFDRPVCKGQIYSWGTATNGGSGLVVKNHRGFSFINFRTGDIYIHEFPRGTTKFELNSMLKILPAHALHNCYKGEISGPFKLRSWTVKKI